MAHGSDDESIARNIRDGFPDKGMVPFKDTLTDQQIWQMVAYLRTQTANLKEKPVYVPDPDGQVVTSEKQTFRMEIVARNLETPWGAGVPARRPLADHRAPRTPAHRRRTASCCREPVKGTPKVWEKQDGGLLDVEVHPQYARNGWIYLVVLGDAAQGTSRRRLPDPPSMTVIVRGKINKDNEWVEQQVLFRAPGRASTTRATRTTDRASSSTRSNHLFFSLGEKQRMLDAQDLSKPTGKIHRVNDDGTVPKDNPFVKRAGALPTIWSYGHRNPQGLAWDPVTGKLWESEHGPTGGDEINIIEPGHNYGWGVVDDGRRDRHHANGRSPGMDESDRLLHADDRAERDDVLHRRASIPGWKNHLFVSALARPAAAAARDERRQGRRTRRRCSTSSAACATSSSVPTGSST